MYFNDLIAVLMVSLLVVATPGPNMAIVIKSSLLNSRSHGVFAAAGVVLGNIVHITYCLAGIGLIISQSIFIFNLIKWLGSGYLVYLGFRALTSKKIEKPESANIPQAQRHWAALRSGFFTDLLNPKATLFFLTLFTQIVRPDTPKWAQLSYGISIALLEFTFFVALTMVVTHKLVAGRFATISHLMERVTGTVLIGLGVRVALVDR